MSHTNFLIDSLSGVLNILPYQHYNFDNNLEFLFVTEKATCDKNTTDKWAIIMDICDKIGSSSASAKESLKIIVKRLNHQDPHVVIQAITVS